MYSVLLFDMLIFWYHAVSFNTVLLWEIQLAQWEALICVRVSCTEFCPAFLACKMDWAFTIILSKFRESLKCTM